MKNIVLSLLGKSQYTWRKLPQIVTNERSRLASTYTWNASLVSVFVKSPYRPSLLLPGRSSSTYRLFSSSPLLLSTPSRPSDPDPIRIPSKTVSTLHSKILSKLPKRYHELFHHYFPQSTTNPISYLISFLFLHELTAIIPLFGFWILFWFIDWDPLSHDTERQGLDSDSEINDPQLYKIDNWATISTYREWIDNYLQKGGEFVKKATKRWNWIELAEGQTYYSSDGNIREPTRENSEAWIVINSDEVPKFLAQGATSYALVKVLAPVRVIISIMLMPMVAKTVFIPMSNVNNRAKSLFLKKFKKN